MFATQNAAKIMRDMLAQIQCLLFSFWSIFCRFFKKFKGTHMLTRNTLFFRLVALISLALSLFVIPLQALALSIGEERKIGEQLLYSIRKELFVLDDPDISQYINNLGKKTLESMGPQYFDYRFFVVKSDQFNAFAAPAGLVFFYSGLIETMQNEDQLLSILAHEMGHVASRHIAQRLDKGTKVSAISLLCGVAGLALGVPGLSQGLLVGSLATGQAINLRYSREDEEQADRLSFEWMQRMQRDPVALKDMLTIMWRTTRYYTGSTTPQYLLTHPNPDARLGYVASLLDAEKQKPAKRYLKIDNFDFLRFKYRVMASASDPDKLRSACTNMLASSKEAEQVAFAHFGLALLDTEERNYDTALHHLSQMQAQYPNRDILEIDRAVILLTSGRSEEARSILDKVVKRVPNDMYGIYQLAKLELMLGNNQNAEQLLQRVVAVMPEYPQVYFDLGQIESNRGRENTSMFYLGKYHLYRGKTKIAKQHFERAAKDTKLPEKMRNEARATLEKLKDLERGF